MCSELPCIYTHICSAIAETFIMAMPKGSTTYSAKSSLAVPIYLSQLSRKEASSPKYRLQSLTNNSTCVILSDHVIFLESVMHPHSEPH